ncbi:MAG: hypothetical protein ABI852_05530 [Gemmatimonadaceae bacterium]
MQHLETERIASFDHDAPSVDELAHLAACTTCRAERNAFSALSQRSMHLADTPMFPGAPRLTNWESLSKALRAEGLIVGGDSVDEVSTAEVTHTVDAPIALHSWTARAKPRSRMDWWRAAAAIVIVALGSGAIGRMSARASAGSSSADSAPVSASVLSGFGGLGNTGYSSIDEAKKALTRTERELDRISLWLTANDPSGKTSDILRRRLAALDQVVAVSYTEWRAAPQDRVLEHYYRTASAAREATLQQLGGALPVGRTLERF